MCAIVVVGNGVALRTLQNSEIAGRGRVVAIAMKPTRRRSLSECWKLSFTRTRSINAKPHIAPAPPHTSLTHTRQAFIIFNFSMLNGARGSAPFAKVNNLLYDFFFSSLHNEKCCFSRSATRMTFQLFFLLIHMQPEALVLRFIRMIDVWLCVELQRSTASFETSRQSECFTSPDSARTCDMEMVPSNPTNENSERAWIEAHRSTFFSKIIHDLSQRKSTWRAQWMKWKKKEIFDFFLLFARLQFYMQRTLSINYLTLACLFFILFYYISNVYAFIYALPQL